AFIASRTPGRDCMAQAPRDSRTSEGHGNHARRVIGEGRLTAMCGIAGIVCGDAAMGMRRVSAMVAAERHRGPDDSGVATAWDAGGEEMSVVFGAARLAIQDLSQAGHQPMHDPTTGNWIVHNGEVYNFAELRRELEAK